MTETRIERGAKRVRAVLGGEVVADTIRPVLVWEVPYYPTYYLPAEDVRTRPRTHASTCLPSSRARARRRARRASSSSRESASPRLLFETGLPTRYYLPKPHVRVDLLTPTATASHCPYKGQAEYWSFGDDHPDVAWSYRTPLPESEKIAGLVAFYNERADIFVDGVLQERPVTKFS